jgi:hypothetical protein
MIGPVRPAPRRVVRLLRVDGRMVAVAPMLDTGPHWSKALGFLWTPCGGCGQFHPPEVEA